MSKLLLLFVLAAAFAGCAPHANRTGAGFDESYLAPEAPKTAVAYTVSFFDFTADETDIMESVWNKAAAPDAKLAALWERNGLRTGFVRKADADAVRSLLKRLSTRKHRLHRELVPRFDLLLRRRSGPTALVYTDAEQTVYRDASDVAVTVRVRTTGSKDSLKVTLAPASSDGAGQPGELDGLAVTFPAEDGGVLLVGPVGKPADSTLGSMIYSGAASERRGQIVMISLELVP